jgi:hypothetical protein
VPFVNQNSFGACIVWWDRKELERQNPAVRRYGLFVRFNKGTVLELIASFSERKDRCACHSIHTRRKGGDLVKATITLCRVLADLPFAVSPDELPTDGSGTA